MQDEKSHLAGVLQVCGGYNANRMHSGCFNLFQRPAHNGFLKDHTPLADAPQSFFSISTDNALKMSLFPAFPSVMVNFRAMQLRAKPQGLYFNLPPSQQHPHSLSGVATQCKCDDGWAPKGTGAYLSIMIHAPVELLSVPEWWCVCSETVFTHTQCQGVLNPSIHRCQKCTVSMLDVPSVVATSQVKNHRRDQTHRKANMSLQGHFCSILSCGWDSICLSSTEQAELL